ncbi:ATP-binding protein [Thermodesulfitimonas autotrophica]|uniref:ATP-binding protein n=1 Tax=Thermodesulfitimonas autotrophica TaxID=1894989 RepID=UPI002FE1C6F2
MGYRVQNVGFKAGASLGTRLALWVSAIIVALTVPSVIWDLREIHREARREMLQQARLVAREFIALRTVIAQNQERINTDPVTGHVYFKHLNPAAVGRQVAVAFGTSTPFMVKQTRLEVRDPANQPDAVEKELLRKLSATPGVPEIWREETLGGHRYLYYMVPLRIEGACLSCHGQPAGVKDIAGYPKEGFKIGSLGGAVSIRISMDNFLSFLARRIWTKIAIAIVFLVLTIGGSIWLSRRLVTEPLQRLCLMAQQLGQGDWKAVRAVCGTGEVVVLSRVLEKVAEQLGESYHLIEEKVAERTRELQKANEELARANRVKSDILANVSHELRTPLTAILAYTEILLDPASGPLTPEQRECLEDIADSGKELLLEVTDLLQMARLEAGKRELSPEPIDMVEVIQEVLGLLEPLAQKKEIRLYWPEQRGKWWVLADRTKVRHILTNLVSNAIKFTPEGGKVAIKLDYGFDTGRCMVVKVTDTGIGIAPAEHEAIFEKFYQPGKHGQGTGLGLALARELVQLHGGRIWVESVPGRGSTFSFTLPLKEEAL